MFCRSDEEHGREMETENFGKTERQMETYGWYTAHRKGKCQRRIRNAKSQVLTALFLRSEVL
jgi:hypothetical protein